MAIPFLCRPGAGTKPTRNRHEMSRDGTETFYGQQPPFFHTGLKYLVPAQAIIIGFKIVENCSWDVPGHVSCRPGNFRPVQTGLKIIILFICFCAGARSTWSWHWQQMWKKLNYAITISSSWSVPCLPGSLPIQTWELLKNLHSRILRPRNLHR